MIRTQIQVTEKQMKSLKTMALEQGVSVAELIRRSIDSFIQSPKVLSDEERIQRALSVIGKFHSGLSDVSVNHDKYLDEIYGS
jgi:hypothetical protein